MRKLIQATAIALLLSFGAEEAWCAAPAGSVNLDSSALFQVRRHGVTYSCGNIPPWQFGRIVKGNFYPSKAEISALKKKLKAATAPSKQAKFKTQIATLKQKQSVAKSLCAAGPPNAQATPTPSSSGPFDAQGNVTALGKSMFGIPSNLSASANRGITFWNNTCNGCHQMFPSGLALKTYPAIRARIQLSPMSFSIPSEITDQNVADITAIVNW